MNSVTAILKYPLEFMRAFGRLVSKVVNFVLLSLVYVLGVGFSSVAAKALGRRFLDLGDSDKDSYWIECDIGGESVSECYRQF